MQMEQTVRDHATFRAVLQAMSRPGTVHQLPGAGEPVLRLLAALIDNEVAVAGLDDATAALAERVARATGCRRTDLAEADFLLVQGGSTRGRLAQLRRGTPEYPETGATVVYLVEQIAGKGGAVTLTGPGIKEQSRPLLSGVCPEELELLAEVNRDFPLGIDAIFVDRMGRVACIPRSTRIGVS